MQENGLWVYHSKKKEPAESNKNHRLFLLTKKYLNMFHLVGPSQGGSCCLTAGIYV